MEYALLVGINDYPGTQNDLHGCRNDVSNLYDVLVKYFGFLPANIRMLQDSRATKAAITSGLKSLVGRAKAGDRIVFHYSGHGSQVRDEEGDELADGKDEIICPYDFGWNRMWISDDDFCAMFDALKEGVHLEVILDSCHSGTGTREIVLDRRSLGRLGAIAFGLNGGASGLAPAGAGGAARTASSWVGSREAGGALDGALWSSACCIRNRYLDPPADIAARADEIFGPELPLRRLGELRALSKAKPLYHVLWAACRSNQYSADADIDGAPNGAFTYYFCRHIRDAAGKLTRAELLARVRASLKFEGFSQVPQLEGPAAERKTGVFAA